MKKNSFNQLVPPNILLEKVQALLSDMQEDKDVHINDIEKYYVVDTKLRIADKRCKVTINDIFGRLIGSIQNRSMMPNVIKYWKYPDMFDQVLLLRYLN